MYLYIHIQNGKAFYVGIGNAKRPYSKRGRSEAWNEIAKNGYEVQIVEEGEKDYILKREKELIEFFGRRITGGQLVNIHPGGNIIQEDPLQRRIRMINNRYNLGRIFSPERRAQMSQLLIGNKRNLGKKHREETKKIIGIKQKGNLNAAGNHSTKKNGKYLNLETGFIFDSVWDINNFFFNSSIKTFISLKKLINAEFKYKGLTFVRIKKNAI